MIIVDTSVWIQHLRRSEDALGELLAAGRVAVHPLTIVELAAGSIANRARTIGLLRQLPTALVAANDDVLNLIERESLMSRGLAAVDLHLLASALAGGDQLWTFDVALQKVARRLGVAWRP